MKKVLSVLLASVMLSACGFEVVDTGNRGIQVRLGEVVGEPLPEGLHFYNPITSDIKEYKVREENFSSQTTIFTKDTQQVVVEFAAVYYPDPSKVTEIYRKFGYEDAVNDKIVRPIVLAALKDSVGQVIADELVQKREMIASAAHAEVKEKLAERDILLTGLSFTNLDFDDAYEQAVEQKVVATQMAAKAKNETIRIEEEARQTIATAKASAESMRIKSQALAQNKGLVEFEAVQKWDGKLPQIQFGGGATPFIDVNGLMKNAR